MPRPDKQINSGGPLYAPVSSARPVVWKKRSGPETAEVSDGPSEAMEITIDDLTISTPVAPHEEVSKWAVRATSAQLPLADEVASEVAEAASRASRVRREPQPVRMEWVVSRTIEGRSYRRTDVLTTVEEHSDF